jgi:hypothetical protein
MISEYNSQMRFSPTKRIILLADQPWEAEFMAAIAKNLREFNPNIFLSLCFTDYYTHFLRKDFLAGLKAGFPGNIFTQSEIYASWQVPTDDPTVDRLYLENWEGENCTDRSLEEIKLVNQWVYGNERSQWHLPISDGWKSKILEDTIRWCENIVEEIEPTIFVSINRSTLPTNIFNTISKTRNIPFYTFINSRIGNRMLLRDDFGYGVSDSLFKNIIDTPDDSQLSNQVELLVSSIILNGQGSYDSLESKVTKDFLLRKEHMLNSLHRDIRKLFGRIYGRIFIQKFERSIRVRRISEDLIKMSYFEFRCILIRHLRLLKIIRTGMNAVPSDKYFFWALHARPEGSVLVLGDGKDEIEELFRCADLIPDGYFVAVKENPEMFGLRSRGFYKKLNSHPRIIAIDPFVSTFSLINNSLGVLGISGTVLLESAILNKPSCAIGHPEFDRFLTHTGFESVQQFIETCILETDQQPFIKIRPYLLYVLQNSSNDDIPIESALNTIQAKLCLERLSRNLLERIESI